MRELGFSVMWPKLQQGQFTTFRFPRRDKDWQVGETVRVVFHPRSKNRKVLGTAQIIGLTIKRMCDVTEAEAVTDGFEDSVDMHRWLRQAHGDRIDIENLNKLTILWLHKEATP